MKNFLFSLDDRTILSLDQIQQELGCSRSAAVRIQARFYCSMNQINLSSPGELYKNLPDLPFMEDDQDD